MGIRVVPNDTVPARVYKHLLPSESQTITVRFHPAVLIKPVALCLAGLAIAGLLSTTIARGNGAVLLVIWLAWLVLVGILLVRVYEWLDAYFVVTTKRLILASGVFTRNVNMMPLNKVNDMTFRRSPLGQVLGYGEFVVESAGPNPAFQRIDYLPYPEQLYLEVCAVLFDKDSDD
jgi:membrane protein YdbS with pleckstrin-like domain